MDERVRRHTELIVERSTELAPDDDVVVRAPTAAEEPVAVLSEAIGRRGDRSMLSRCTPRASSASLRVVDPEALRPKDHEFAAMEAAAPRPEADGETVYRDGRFRLEERA